MHLSSKSKRTSAKPERDSVSASKAPQSKKTAFKKKNVKRRDELCVFFEDEDVTPKLLSQIVIFTKKVEHTRTMSQLEIKSHYEFSMFGNMSTAMLHSHMHSHSVAAASHQSYASILNRTDDILADQSLVTSEILSNSSEKEGPVISLEAMPGKLNITLTETPVFYLLEITSTTENKGSPEGDWVEKDNEYYDYLTLGKGRNRKTTNAEIQTTMSLLKTRSTIAERNKRRNHNTFASVWDMYDTYGNLITPETNVAIVVPDNSKKLQSSLTLNLSKLTSSLEIQNHEIEVLIKNPRFQQALIVMERVLANNVFNQEQKRFRGLTQQDPFRPDIEFQYNLDLLWTFKNITVEGHPVTAMQWNPHNTDILAVGYGKFLYSDDKPGLLYCWNIKNPTQPEREYKFSSPVTSLAFSEYEPNIIAVGCYDGTISFLDICKREMELVMGTIADSTVIREPIWQIAWFPPDGYNININHVICVSQDGRVSSFQVSKTNELTHIQMMRVTGTDGKIRGVYQPKQCPAHEIPILKFTSALTITKHPKDKSSYFVGTCEGSIHKCSENYQNQHLDMQMVHNGPVYSMEYSKFCNKLFLTAGADWCINIWAEDIKEPLVTMTKSMEYIEGATWSPSNSAIIAHIAGNDIYLWDIQRKTYLPASVHHNPANCRNTVITFTPSGRNLVIGDIEGNVHIYSLEDMPFPPFYPGEMLTKVIYKILITRKDLVTALQKLHGLSWK